MLEKLKTHLFVLLAAVLALSATLAATLAAAVATAVSHLAVAPKVAALPMTILYLMVPSAGLQSLHKLTADAFGWRSRWASTTAC